jgi:hypothetical protein
VAGESSLAAAMADKARHMADAESLGHKLEAPCAQDSMLNNQLEAFANQLREARGQEAVLQEQAEASVGELATRTKACVLMLAVKEELEADLAEETRDILMMSHAQSILPASGQEKGPGRRRPVRPRPVCRAVAAGGPGARVAAGLPGLQPGPASEAAPPLPRPPAGGDL